MAIATSPLDGGRQGFDGMVALDELRPSGLRAGVVGRGRNGDEGNLPRLRVESTSVEFAPAQTFPSGATVMAAWARTPGRGQRGAPGCTA